jgi:hypothetical protein
MAHAGVPPPTARGTCQTARQVDQPDSESNTVEDGTFDPIALRQGRRTVRL